MTNSKIFRVEHHKSADGFSYTVKSPHNVSVERFDHYNDAYNEAVARNAKTRADSGREPALDLVGTIVAWEEGELDTHETVEFFAYLIRSAEILSALQGAYQRAARHFVEQGLITEAGEVVPL